VDWTLADGEELHARAPETFLIPPKRERKDLRAGSLAKLLFLYPAQSIRSEQSVGERMWVEVTEVKKGGYRGKVCNSAVCPELLPELGDIVEFEPKHVIPTRSKA